MGQAVQIDDRMMNQVSAAFHSQHPLHGLFFNVFEEIGGQEFLVDWAQKNPSKFITLFCKMSPTLMPTSGMVGDINIQINNSLERTALDD